MSIARFKVTSDMDFWKEFKKVERELEQITRFVQNDEIIITSDELHEFAMRYKSLADKLEELRREIFVSRIKQYKQEEK